MQQYYLGPRWQRAISAICGRKFVANDSSLQLLFATAAAYSTYQYAVVTLTNFSPYYASPFSVIFSPTTRAVSSHLTEWHSPSPPRISAINVKALYRWTSPGVDAVRVHITYTVEQKTHHNFFYHNFTSL